MLCWGPVGGNLHPLFFNRGLVLGGRERGCTALDRDAGKQTPRPHPRARGDARCVNVKTCATLPVGSAAGFATRISTFKKQSEAQKAAQCTHNKPVPEAGLSGVMLW